MGVKNDKGEEGEYDEEKIKTYNDFTHYTIILSFNVDCCFISFLPESAPNLSLSPSQDALVPSVLQDKFHVQTDTQVL